MENKALKSYQNLVKNFIKNDLLAMIKDGYKFANDGLAWQSELIEDVDMMLAEHGLTGLVSDYKTDWELLRRAVAGDRTINTLVNEVNTKIFYYKSVLDVLKADNYEQVEKALNGYDEYIKNNKLYYPNTTYDVLHELCRYVKNENTFQFMKKWSTENINKLYTAQYDGAELLAKIPVTRKELETDVLKPARWETKRRNHRHYVPEWYEEQRLNLLHNEKEMKEIIKDLGDNTEEKELANILKDCGCGRDETYEVFEAAFGHSSVPSNFQLCNDWDDDDEMCAKC